jgi:SSS family solute:Na+ symporter
MELHPVDILIILGYILLTIFIGFYISRRASKDLESYFLGGKSLPWYILGISNASGMFDITGTMWLVYILFVYGLKSIWLPWLWPVFNQIFLMVYLSVWLRRSNVMTGAEWIRTRFGDGRGARLAHIIVIVFALVSVIGFLAYGFKGIGKFSSAFLPWVLSSDPDTNANIYALIFMGITTLYVVKGGMFSVVFTEVLQFLIMTIASIAVGVIAMQKVAPEVLASVIPPGWKDTFFGWHLNLDWTGILDSVNTKIAEDGYSLFTLFFMMMLFKGILISAAGPAPNYDMQRILSTKTPGEAAKMSFFVNIVLFFPRYLLIAGLTVLALVFFRNDLIAMGDDIDFELILPYAMKNFLPIGLLGILIAGLLSAFMSTFAATVNAAPAYIVNDLYKRYIKPNASDRTYVRLSYFFSFLVVVIGIIFGFIVESIDSVLQWIVSALWGGYTAANLLKWYWWRFNGYGYFWGMVTGILASLIFPIVAPEMSPLYGFPYILLVSILGCYLGSYLTDPDDEAVLLKFYTTVRPWGFWKPIHLKAVNTDPGFQKNKDFSRDMFNIIVGIIWQTSIVSLAIYLVIQEYRYFIVSTVILIVTSIILKFSWWNRIKDL